MEKLNQYYDMIIYEYADKPTNDAYCLDVEQIPHFELIDLIDKMMKEDTNLRDVIMSKIQQSIDNRIPHFESDHRFYREAI